MQEGMRQVPALMLSVAASVSSTAGLWLEEGTTWRWQGCPDGSRERTCGRTLCQVPWWRPQQGLVGSIGLCLEEQSLEPVPSRAPQDRPPSRAWGRMLTPIPWGWSAQGPHALVDK